MKSLKYLQLKSFKKSPFIHNLILFLLLLFISQIQLRSQNYSIDPNTIALYNLHSGNYSNALEIYKRNSKKMKFKDKIHEIECLSNLELYDSVCIRLNSNQITEEYIKFFLPSHSNEILSRCNNISKEIHCNSEIENQIYFLYNLDQLIRSENIGEDQSSFNSVDKLIGYKLNAILKDTIILFNFSEITFSRLNLLLIHQCRQAYFYKSNQKIINRIFTLGLIDNYEYASITDQYYKSNFGYQKYGTICDFNRDTCTVIVEQPQIIDSIRKEIGLPPIINEFYFKKFNLIVPIWVKQNSYNDDK